MSTELWTAADIPDQAGRTVIVTGANSGLGFETARRLAEHGAHVIMTVRSEDKGREATEAIRGEFPRANLEARLLDLADLDSVAAFAENLRADHDHVDVLVNNGGIMCPPRSLSPQGHERQFATNHLGHFALTGHLMGLLEAGRDPRVVTISSVAHKQGRIHFEDLSGAEDYGRMAFYRQSKFANAVFGLELDRRLRATGSPVRSLLAHPGLTSTQLVDKGFVGPTRLLGRVVLALFAQPLEQGTLPQLRAATDPKAQGGQFFGPDGKSEHKGHPVLVEAIPAAEDPETAARLWTLSEELTGVRYPVGAEA